MDLEALLASLCPLSRFFISKLIKTIFVLPFWWQRMPQHNFPMLSNLGGSSWESQHLWRPHRQVKRHNCLKSAMFNKNQLYIFHEIFNEARLKFSGWKHYRRTDRSISSNPPFKCLDEIKYSLKYLTKYLTKYFQDGVSCLPFLLASTSSQPSFSSSLAGFPRWWQSLILDVL